MRVNYFFQVCGDLAEDAMEEVINSKAFKTGVKRMAGKYPIMKEQG